MSVQLQGSYSAHRHFAISNILCNVENGLPARLNRATNFLASIEVHHPAIQGVEKCCHLPIGWRGTKYFARHNFGEVTAKIQVFSLLGYYFLVGGKSTKY